MFNVPGASRLLHYNEEAPSQFVTPALILVRKKKIGCWKISLEATTIFKCFETTTATCVVYSNKMTLITTAV